MRNCNSESVIFPLFIPQELEKCLKWRPARSNTQMGGSWLSQPYESSMLKWEKVWSCNFFFFFFSFLGEYSSTFLGWDLNVLACKEWLAMDWWYCWFSSSFCFFCDVFRVIFVLFCSWNWSTGWQAKVWSVMAYFQDFTSKEPIHFWPFPQKEWNIQGALRLLLGTRLCRCQPHC